MESSLFIQGPTFRHRNQETNTGSLTADSADFPTDRNIFPEMSSMRWKRPSTHSWSPSWPHPTLTTRFLPADRQPWTDKHPDLLTCGRCLQTFPLEAITAFVDHKKLGCQLFRGPSPCQGSGE